MPASGQSEAEYEEEKNAALLLVRWRKSSSKGDSKDSRIEGKACETNDGSAGMEETG